MARRIKRVAVVRCAGGPAPDDRCEYGCLGCGACVDVCRKDAVKLNQNGVAQVNRDNCMGCGLCAKACPQGIIDLVPRDQRILELCSNHDAGATARKDCHASCIACGACERVCTCDGIHVSDNLARINLENCISCGMCASKCPRGVIHDVYGIIAAGL